MSTKFLINHFIIPREDKKDLPIILIKTEKSNNILNGIILIQEWWGINNNIIHIGEKFALNNFLVLIPDLYRGKSTDNALEASHYMANLDWLDASKDIELSGKFLKNEMNCPKVAIIGYCVGGALTIIAASQQQPYLDAAICYYGYIPDDKIGNPSNIKIPIQCQFALKDHCKGFADSKTADYLEFKLKKGNVPYEFLRWNTGHSFMNEDYVLRRSAKYPEPYNSEIAEKSFQKCLEFLSKYF